MSSTTYSILHVISGFLLVGLTFQACAAPDPARRKRNLMLSGILGIVMLVAGFGLLAKLQLAFKGWVIVKLACWLALAALGGVAFRKPEAAGKLALVAAVIVAVAVTMAYTKPF